MPTYVELALSNASVIVVTRVGSSIAPTSVQFRRLLGERGPGLHNMENRHSFVGGLGFVLLLLFLAMEARLGAQAMMPLSLYGSRSFAAANVLTLLLYFALGGALSYLPFGLIRLGGYSATQAGAALLRFALIMGFGAQFAGMLSDRFGPQQSLTFGPVIAGCGLALLAFADFQQSYLAASFPAICVFGIGMTITVPPLTSMVMSSVGDAHAGVVSGVNNAVARVAGLFAVAALGAVLFASFLYHLAGAPRAQADEALNAILAGQAGITEAATAAFERALRTVLQAAALCALLGGILLWLWIRPIGPQSARKADIKGGPSRAAPTIEGPIVDTYSRLTSSPACRAWRLDVALKVLCLIKGKAGRTSSLPIQRAGSKGVTNRTFERGTIPASDIGCHPIGAFQKRHERRLRIV